MLPHTNRYPNTTPSPKKHSELLIMSSFADIVNLEVIDDIGNRNNLVIAPRARTDGGPAATTPKGAEESKSAVEDAPIPTLVVEMTDTQPRYGDDFGSHATAGQRDAHDIRAADAKPDYVIVRPDEDSVHQAAEDAAEVADSAALIDREKSPLPMSDEDAGRTGERRLSVTPIQQVADVANEVADVAALIDEDDFDKEEVCIWVASHKAHS